MRSVSPESSPPSEPLSEDVLTPEEEAQVRARVRERLLAKEAEARAQEEAHQAQRLRRLEAERLRWKVIEEETERFHRERGRVRYVSSSGQVLWLTPEEISRRRSARVRARRRGRSRRSMRIGDVVFSTLRVAGASMVAVIALVIALAAAIYVMEFV